MLGGPEKVEQERHALHGPSLTLGGLASANLILNTVGNATTES